jgi:hypothetical protein
MLRGEVAIFFTITVTDSTYLQPLAYRYTELTRELHAEKNIVQLFV